MKIELLAYRNDKVIVLTHNKVASRVCDALFPPKKYFITINPQDLTDIASNPIESGKDTIVEDLKLILNGKSKKELILLYRNPIDRWISGTLQEFYGQIDSKNLFFWCKQFDNPKVYEWFSTTNISRPGFESSQAVPPESIRVETKILVRDFFDHLKKYGHFTGHSSPFLHAYTILLAGSNVDSNKLKFLNIDDVDAKYLIKYVDTTDKKISKGISELQEKVNYSNSYFKSLFRTQWESIFRKEKAFEDLFIGEQPHYEFIQGHPNNIVVEVKKPSKLQEKIKATTKQRRNPEKL